MSQATGKSVDQVGQGLFVRPRIFVEKLSLACYEGLFAVSDDDLKEDEHRSIACVHSFLQNMYLVPLSPVQCPLLPTFDKAT